MKRKMLGAAGCGTLIFAVSSILFLSSKAQESSQNPRALQLRTNWVGYLVYGRNESGDAIEISRRPYPIADPQVRIGLRSDGVLIWQKVGAEH